MRFYLFDFILRRKVHDFIINRRSIALNGSEHLGWSRRAPSLAYAHSSAPLSSYSFYDSTTSISGRRGQHKGGFG